jgi:hypothetical protein
VEEVTGHGNWGELLDYDISLAEETAIRSGKLLQVKAF